MKPDCRNQWLDDSEVPSKMIHIDVPLRMRGGISIRRYASKKGSRILYILQIMVCRLFRAAVWQELCGTG